MRRLVFFVFAFACLLTAGTVRGRADDSKEFIVNNELVQILDSFDDKKQNPNHVPSLSEILEARGTLVFFDNTNSSGKKPQLGGNIKTKASGALNRTLDRARRRLSAQERKNAKKAAANSAKTRKLAAFVANSAKEPDLTARERPADGQPRYYPLNYDGEKAVALIPPDTLVEVPFLKHIPYFFSRIEILGNGAIRVTETIERVVEPAESDFYGIERSFPKYHTDRTGKKHRTNLMLLEAFLNEKPIRAKLTPDLDGFKIDLRGAEPLPSGMYMFRFSYLLFNKIAEFENNAENAQTPTFKELIWDVTGIDWDIPITRAAAVVLFPPDSVLYSHTAATGGAAGVGRNYRLVKDKKSNDLSYVLTFPLAPYESLTILANWGEKASSSMFQNGKLDRFIIEHGTFAAAFIAFLFVLSYYLTTFFAQRKNQERTPVKTQPLQKGDLTPAVMNYALTKKISSKTLFVLLLGMAAKNFLAFDEQSDGTPILIKMTDKENNLTALERKIAKRLFSKDSTSFAVTNANMLRLKRLTGDVEKSLTREYRRKFTVFPQPYFWFGILMAAVAVGATAALSLFPAITAATAAACVLFFIPAAFSGTRIWTVVCKNGVKAGWKKTFKPLFVFAPSALLLIAALTFFGMQTTLATALAFFAVLVCVGVFKVLLRAPSAAGNAILDNMEGYKLYLSSQDDTLLTVMRNANQKIKALYSKHLPFAVAMGLETPWTKRFAAFDDEDRLKPDWYKGKLPFNETFAADLYAAFARSFPQREDAGKKVKESRFAKKAR